MSLKDKVACGQVTACTKHRQDPCSAKIGPVDKRVPPVAANGPGDLAEIGEAERHDVNPVNAILEILDHITARVEPHHEDVRASAAVQAVIVLATVQAIRASAAAVQHVFAAAAFDNRQRRQSSDQAEMVSSTTSAKDLKNLAASFLAVPWIKRLPNWASFPAISAFAS